MKIISSLLKRMPHTWAHVYHPSCQCRMQGFTLLEVLLAVTLSVAIAATSVVGFTQFNNTQRLQNAALDVAITLEKAKSRSQTQVKPDSIIACRTNQLRAYEVRICDSPLGQCTQVTPGRYELHIICGATNTLLEAKQLPSALSFSTITNRRITFAVLTGAATNGSLQITGFGKQRTITVSSAGIINVQ